MMTMVSEGAVTLYHEKFRNPVQVPTDSDNLPVPASINWRSYHGASATDITANTSKQPNSVLINWSMGSPNSDGPGYLYTREQLSATSLNRNYAVIGPTFTQLGNTALGDLNVHFRGNISHSDIDVRLLLNVGGQWYVRNQKINMMVGTQGNMNASTPNSSLLHDLTLNYTASQWSIFNFAPSSTMGIGAGAALDLSGDIQQIGFFVENPSSGTALYMARFDGLSVQQVPEPQRMLFLLGGLMGLLFIRRR